MFDIGLGEIIVLGAVALLIFGPDHLPKAAAQAGRFVKDLRTMATAARQELSDSAGMDDLGKDLKSLADLHPKRLASSVWEDSGPPAGGSNSTAPPAAPRNPVPGSTPASTTPPPVAGAPLAQPSQSAGASFDPDAT